jgi:hypothetical protein
MKGKNYKIFNKSLYESPQGHHEYHSHQTAVMDTTDIKVIKAIMDTTDEKVIKAITNTTFIKSIMTTTDISIISVMLWARKASLTSGHQVHKYIQGTTFITDATDIIFVKVIAIITVTNAIMDTTDISVI